MIKLVNGKKYNWKGQEERLTYVGHNWSGNGFWHQFEEVSNPGVVWCEVQDSDLDNIEESSPTVGPEGVSEGETCNRNGCDGTMVLADPEGACTCHCGNPPCGWCTTMVLYCDECTEEHVEHA